MTTKDILKKIREDNNLTQEQFGQRVLVTRQAVSRWETGETEPNNETLKILSREFNVSINTLLGSPRQLFCQCCGMPLTEDENISREEDRSFNEDYCKWCYTDGKFTYVSKDALLDFLMDHMPNPEGTADPESTADPEASPAPTEAPAETPNPLTTTGWTYPVPGAVRSAGTWYYNSGGVHLGYDFAISPGSAIYAAGNGVILRSADACPTYGGLGSGCGYPGSYGGGNQVYLLTKINGSLYAVKYLHMMSGSPIAQGTIVTAGTQIGKVGSSGNSSGPHCHIEIFWLGSADNFSNYAKTWNLDLAFGCGWGYSALSRLCENGVGAPCRIRPETIFGY